MNTGSFTRARQRTLLCIFATLIIHVHGKLVFAEEIIRSAAGEAISVDTRSFELHFQRDREGSVGVLSSGGYCHVGAKEKKYKYRVVAAHPKDVMVEIVTHPADYDYVVHDLVGALQFIANGGSRRGSNGDTGNIDFVSWKVVEDAQNQTIAVVRSASTPKGGMVAWFFQSTESNRLVTVVVSYMELEGLPKQLIDEFLTQYPSTVDKDTFLPADWVDDDLKKWAQILRNEQTSEILLSIAARNIWPYEREAWERAKAEGRDWEPWDAMKLGSEPIGSDELKEKARTVTDKVEAWRTARKRNP